MGSDGKEIQSNVIDNESVKMPISHGVLQGYNAQALVDPRHEVILAAEAFRSQDPENLAPMLLQKWKELPFWCSLLKDWQPSGKLKALM